MLDRTDIPYEIYSYIQRKGSVLYFYLSPHGKIMDANEYAKKISGRDLIGDQFKDIIVDFNGRFNLNAILNASSQEQLINIETPSGLPQSFQFSFVQVNGHILAFGQLDVEEMENMRLEVLALNKDLNNLSRELHKKNAQLKLLNDEKNRFLGMAAHDLRSPIGVILSYTGFIMDEAENVLAEEQIGFLNTIRTSCAFMKRLVDDFLDVSAIEAGKFEIDLEPASIHDVLSSALNIGNLHAGKKHIGIEVINDVELPLILMDAAKIQQVMTNLVSNAIEHSRPHDSVTISISNHHQSVLFSIRDKGPGMATEETDKLFKAYEKTKTRKTAGEKSTGLGLLISRKIIEAHGGKIWIDSRLGEGTTIAFELPFRMEEE